MTICIDCNAEWTSLVLCHCVACHRSFTSAAPFDLHLTATSCRDPLTLFDKHGRLRLTPYTWKNDVTVWGKQGPTPEQSGYRKERTGRAKPVRSPQPKK